MQLRHAVVSMIGYARVGRNDSGVCRRCQLGPCEMKGGVLGFPRRTFRLSHKTTLQCTVFVKRQSLVRTIRVTLLFGACEKNFTATKLADQTMTALHQLKMGRPQAMLERLPLLNPTGTPIFELSGPTIETASLIACLPQYGTS